MSDDTKSMEAETDVNLQEVWEACLEGDKEMKQLLLDILIDDVIDRFGTMFIPYRFMGADKKWGHVIQRHDIELVFPHKLLFKCGEKQAELAIEVASHEVLAGALVPAENIVKAYLKLNRSIPKREDVSAQVRKLHATTRDIPEMHKCATHMWVGREVMGAMMRSPDWTPFMEITVPKRDEPDPNPKFLDALSQGNIGEVKDFGIEVYTDGLRYDTLQVLEGDEWGVFSKYGDAKVWVDWPTEITHDFKTRKTTINCTLRIGTEEKTA